MNTPDDPFGSFALTFTDKGHVWYFALHPEMYAAGTGISPTGNYFVYCLHPTRGSCSYLLEQDAAGDWSAAMSPGYAPREIIQWLGQFIEKRIGITFP